MTEEMIPYTTTHTVRGSRVGFLGFEGADFGALWPLLSGTVLSVALAIAFVAGGIEAGWLWQTRAALAMSPFTAGYVYLRLLVEGRPPHFKGDLWRTCCRLRISTNLVASTRAPLLPRAVVDNCGTIGIALDDDVRSAFGLEGHR